MFHMLQDSAGLVEMCLHSHKRCHTDTPVTPTVVSSQVVPVCCRAPKVFPHGMSGDALQYPGSQSLAPRSGHRPEALAQTQTTRCCVGPAAWGPAGQHVLIPGVGIPLAVPCCVPGLSPSRQTRSGSPVRASVVSWQAVSPLQTCPRNAESKLPWCGVRPGSGSGSSGLALEGIATSPWLPLPPWLGKKEPG